MKKLEALTKKWWFFVAILILQSVAMPVSTQNFDQNKISDIIWTTLGNSIQVKMSDYFIYFQIISLAFIILLIAYKNKFAKAFNAYVFISYIVFAFIQNIAITEIYGVSVVTVNVIMFLFVAYVWFKEFLLQKNDYSFANLNLKNCWILILAIIAYWCPLNQNMEFDFNPINFLYNGSALAFCLTTPLFLAIMTINIPKINIVTYRITAIFGVVIGLYNMLSFMNPQTINIGIIHIPLLVISSYAMIKSYQIKIAE